MKKITIALISLLMANTTWAASAMDGVWSCQLRPTTGSSIYQNYLSFHSKTDGTTLFAVLSESNDTDYFKFGIGTIQGNTFSGSTKMALPITLTLGTDGILAGTAQGTNSIRQIIDLNIRCMRVW